MPTIHATHFSLTMQKDGTQVVIDDHSRNIRWLLDEQTRLVSRDVTRFNHDPYRATNPELQHGGTCLLGPGRAELTSDNTIRVVHQTPIGRVQLSWSIQSDRLHITADPDIDNCITGLTLPGTFIPDSPDDQLWAIPNGQGVLHTGKGPSFYKPRWGCGSDGFAMAMFGHIAGRAGLLCITETEDDAVLHWEKPDNLPIRTMWRMEPSMGALSYQREVVIEPTDGDLTCLCKTFRRYEHEHGRIITWQQKLSERPKVANLFGAAMLFTGYWHDDELDYIAALRQVRNAGISKAFVYPVLHTFNLPEGEGWRFPGQAADYRQLVDGIHELGYQAGGFIYIMDTPVAENDSRMADFRLDQNGKPAPYWEMEGLTWYSLAREARTACAARVLKEDLADMDGVHFDVLTCAPSAEDYHPDHPTSATDELAGRRDILRIAAEQGMIISSEGFRGRFTDSYDLCNTKYAHVLGGDDYCTVPMTMLVYHDCAYHTWWEVDNYNNAEHRHQYGRDHPARFPWGGGYMARQSAIDALMGTPPDIFPCGLQWNLIPHSRNLYTYKFRPQDESVRQAIEYARPVMNLHERIAPLEMIEHRMHRPDGSIQETVFADGTRVVANFANVKQEGPDGIVLDPESWQAIW